MPIKENRYTRRENPHIWLPDAPANTEYEQNIWRLADAAAGLPIYQRPDRMYLSATHYGQLLDEMRESRVTPKDMPPYLIFGKNTEFRVLNAGTDDEAEINRLNRETPGAIEFSDRVKQFTQ